MNPARRCVPGPYVEPFPRPVERDEPFPGAEAWGIMTAGQHAMYRLTCEAEWREGFSDSEDALHSCEMASFLPTGLGLALGLG